MCSNFIVTIICVYTICIFLVPFSFMRNFCMFVSAFTWMPSKSITFLIALPVAFHSTCWNSFFFFDFINAFLHYPHLSLSLVILFSLSFVHMNVLNEPNGANMCIRLQRLPYFSPKFTFIGTFF